MNLNKIPPKKPINDWFWVEDKVGCNRCTVNCVWQFICELRYVIVHSRFDFQVRHFWHYWRSQLINWCGIFQKDWANFWPRYLQFLSATLIILVRNSGQSCTGCSDSDLYVLNSSCKFFITSTEFDKNISDWRYDCTDHKNGFDFFMRIVKWPKIAVKKCQNLIFKVNFQRQKSFQSF